MSILPTFKSDSECYTEATLSLYGSDEDSDVAQDIGIAQAEEQDSGVKQVQECGRGSAESDSWCKKAVFYNSLPP